MKPAPPVTSILIKDASLCFPGSTIIGTEHHDVNSKAIDDQKGLPASKKLQYFLVRAGEASPVRMSPDLIELAKNHLARAGTFCRHAGNRSK